MKVQHTAALLFAWLFHLVGTAQVFEDLALDLGIFFQHEGPGEDSGGGMSFHDFDGDGDDDLSLCQYLGPAVFYENVDGEFVEKPAIPELINARSIQWVDFDNDGDADLFVSRSFDEQMLFECIGDWSFQNITATSGIEMPEAYTYGSCWGDYNNDQLLDLYICNYEPDEHENFLFKNNGDGTFENVTQLTNTGGGYRHSFQATFLDYDRDGWQDIFIINDRLLSDNIMLHNNEGVFEDVTEEAMGLYNIFSMSNSVADYDNDSDQDIYISNNPQGHLLHRNEGDGTFTEVASNAGIATYDHCWAGQWIDIDLDGWQDLHICCSPFWGEPGQNKFYRSTQDGYFVFDLSPGFEGDEGSSHSSAVADYNNDGVFDIFVMNSEPDVSSLWTSSGVESNYLKVSLEGTGSNKDAIGSWIEIWASGEYQMRYTFCGEGYLNQNSDAEIFGLSEHVLVDSMKITWPNGTLETWHDIEVNQHLHLIEGSTAPFLLNDNPNLQICVGDSIMVSAPDYASYLWSTGDTTQSLTITTPGAYEVHAWTDLGAELHSDTLYVNWFPQTVIQADVQINLCHGDTLASIELSNDSGTGLISCEWDSGSEGSTLINLSAGSYQYSWMDQNGCVTSGFVDFSDPQPIEIILNIQHISCYDEQDGAVEVNASGGTGELSFNWGENDPAQNLGPGTFEVTVTDDNACTAQALATIEEPEQLELETELVETIDNELWTATAQVMGGTSPHQVFWSTGEISESIQISTGSYGVWVLDDNGCMAFDDFEITGVSIEANERFGDIAIFPNPVSGHLTIETDQMVKEVRIVDITGKTVKSFTNAASDLKIIDVSFLSPGLFFCFVETEFQKQQKLILKQ